MAMKLISPWINFYREICALFKRDKDVSVVYDEDENVITLYVDSATKADALDYLLPMERTFGNVTVKISVVPSNNEGEHPENLIEDAFRGNPAYAFHKTISGILSNDITYVVFENSVVQYFNDDLGDIYGQRSCLYQDIAKDILGHNKGLYFCTDMPPYGDLDMDEETWP